MATYYGKGWNELLRYVGECSVEEARWLFRDGPSLDVVVGDGLLTDPESAEEAEASDAMRPVPEFNLTLVPKALTDDGEGELFRARTRFFDEQGSVVMTYHWRQEGDRLFLWAVAYWQYPDDGAFHKMYEALLFEEITFSLDGTTRTVTNDKSKPMLDVVDRREVDLSANWEPIPQFGQWEGLGRADRKGTLTRHHG